MKTFRRILLIVLVLTTSLMMFGCANQPLEILISGDIETHRMEINLSELVKKDFQNGDEKLSGYPLDQVIGKTALLMEESWLLLTASDMVSARIDIESSGDVYIVDDGDKLNIKAPDHPRLVGIKDLIEITVIEKNHSGSGLKLISEDQDQAVVLSYGNARLKLFEQEAENKLNDVIAYKHLPKENYRLSELTLSAKNLMFLANQDIVKAGNAKLLWSDGYLSCEIDSAIHTDIKGFVSGTETVLFDAYFEMKRALDNDEKVMLILPDGLSLQQVKHFDNDLSFFNKDYIVASSVHPAISNVALAGMVTGKSPYENGVLERGVKWPDCPDIFEYALNLDKKASYIEGNSKLINTSLDPKLNVADANGYTDTAVFNCAMAELEKDPDLIFVHFHGIDDVNHMYSPISEQAKAKIIKTEGYVTQLMQNFDGTVIIVPDHGAITYYEDGVARGKHGLFEKNDMLIPYYLFKGDK